MPKKNYTNIEFRFTFATTLPCRQQKGPIYIPKKTYIYIYNVHQISSSRVINLGIHAKRDIYTYMSKETRIHAKRVLYIYIMHIRYLAHV